MFTAPMESIMKNNLGIGQKALYFIIACLPLFLNSCSHNEMRSGITIFPGPNNSPKIDMEISTKLISEGTSYIDYSDTTNVIEIMDSISVKKLYDYLNGLVNLGNDRIYDWGIRRSPFNDCKIYYLWKGKRSVLAVSYMDSNSYFLLRQGDLNTFNKVVALTHTSIKDTQQVMDYVKIFLLSVGYMPNKDLILLRDMKDWDDFVSTYEKIEKRRKAVYWNIKSSAMAHYNYLKRQWEDKEFVKSYAQAYENRFIQGPVHYTDALFLEGYGHMRKNLPIYIREDISPPKIIKTETGYKVELYCWTLEGGNFDYWRINIQKDGQVSYKLDRLATEVGPFVPVEKKTATGKRDDT